MAALALACACSSKGVPVAELTSDFGAQREFQMLRGRWEHGSPETRLALDAPLARFARSHADDPTARVSNAMIALIAVEKNELDRAERLARPLVDGPPGTTRDMASVALGASTRRRGRSKEALAMLEPLYGKVIDPFARDVLSEEAALAAVAAGDLDTAIRFLRGWLAQSAEDRKKEVEAKVAAVVARLPAPPLVSLVQLAQGTDEMKSSLLVIVGRRLAAIAIQTGDVTLARLLVAMAGPLLGDQADDVARVAARGAAVRLDANTVGLLLSHRSDELTRRGLEVARGLAFAGGLPGGSAKLLTRDDRGDAAQIDEALALLSSDGAGIIVAGLDSREANAAFDYAVRTGAPMILLRPPDRVVDPAGHVFVLGDNVLLAREKLVAAAIAAGHERIALLVGDRGESEAPPPTSDGGVVAIQPCGAPLDFVHSSGANALIIDGGPTCIREALHGANPRVPVGLGLDGPTDVAVHDRVSAGMFPVGTTSTDPELTALLAEGRGPPSWWTGLGHDAGKLAWAAVSKLAASRDADAQNLAARKDRVVELVAKEEATLWTTEARGFAGARLITRDVGVRSNVTPEEVRRRDAPRAPRR